MIQHLLKRRRLAMVSVLVGIAAWLAYRHFVPVPPDAIAELIAQGGVRTLRDPMRPLGAGPRVLVFAMDGVGRDQFVQAAGRAPRLRGLLGSQQNGRFTKAYSAPDVLTILPSTTMAVWVSVFTGEPPAKTGVPGNEWFVREERRFLAPAPVTVEDARHTVEMLTDGLLGNAVKTPTIFERVDVRSYASLAPVYRGADLFSTPRPSSVGAAFSKLVSGIDGDDSVAREVYSAIDDESVSTVIEVLRSRGIPRLQVVYFPGVDLYTHVASDPLESQVAYVSEVLDEEIGRVLDVYQEQGLMGDTYVVFISDHGHTPVINDDRHALGVEGEDEPTAVIEQLGFRLRPATLDSDEGRQDYSAAVAYQGAMAYIYLADRSGCEKEGERCDWSVPPRFNEDVMPLARAFYEANQTGRRVAALQGTLDLIFARRPVPLTQDAALFEVFDGRRLVPVGDYLRMHPREDLLRFEERMAGLARGPYGHRAGDILLLAKSGTHRPIEERFYFSGQYHSWHGSPSAQDSRVPLVLAHPRRSPEALETMVRGATGESPSVLGFAALLEALFRER
jgi:hypothetical protein